MRNNSILIINGIDSINDLSVLGIDLAQYYHDAEIIFLITSDGKVKQLRYRIQEPLNEIWYYDAENNIKTDNEKSHQKTS